MKLIYIEWQDATENTLKWFALSEAIEWHDEPLKHIVRQVGWVIKEDNKGITLAGRYNIQDENYQDNVGLLQHIPKTWILKRKQIKI